MLARVRTLLEMIKFSHTLFALPFALLSGAMAAILEFRSGRTVEWLEWLAILLCMGFARSAAMSFNRLVDSKWDRLNPRTQTRHLATGELTPKAVAAFTIVCSLGFIASTGLFYVSAGNGLPILLSLPVLAYLLTYSLTKRFTSLSHFWLGIALMLSPVCAWIALRANLQWPPVLLGLAVFCWVSGFDIIYACQDSEFDREVGLRSLPARVGIANALRVAMGCHICMVVLLFALPLTMELGLVYRGGIVAIAALLVYEHALVRPDNLSKVNVAFFNVNTIISVGLLVITLADLLA